MVEAWSLLGGRWWLREAQGRLGGGAERSGGLCSERWRSRGTEGMLVMTEVGYGGCDRRTSGEL